MIDLTRWATSCVTSPLDYAWIKCQWWISSALSKASKASSTSSSCSWWKWASFLSPLTEILHIFSFTTQCGQMCKPLFWGALTSSWISAWKIAYQKETVADKDARDRRGWRNGQRRPVLQHPDEKPLHAVSSFGNLTEHKTTIVRLDVLFCC